MRDTLPPAATVEVFSRLDAPSIIAACVFAVVLVLFLRSAARKYKGKPWRPSATTIDTRLADPAWQMSFVKAAQFETQPLLNKGEFQVLLVLEAVTHDVKAGFRVMAQTSLGELLRPTRTMTPTDADLAYRSINSKRADFVIVDRYGIAVVAVEYQGHGHYQGTARQRDAIKREAFLKANVAFVEVPANFNKVDVAKAVRSILERHANSRPPLSPA
ncbi:MAG: DUF2726 domain-containing protein [Proteobacteria bacterium]|nr:DUF2726 domain-containing protein [Pseudomonadota bacterium]